MVLPLFLAVVLVSAVATYYTLFSDNFDVNNIDGMGTFTRDIDGDYEFGDVIVGEPINLLNDLENNRDISIITTNGDENIGVEYKSTLELTKKDVDFEKDVWDIIDGDINKAQVEYTIVGNKFSATTDKATFVAYSLIYYKDNSNRFDSPAQAILVEDVEGNLPYEDDQNIDEYDYCLTEEYDTCHGAKIWYVPSSAINVDKTLDWSRASEFYFESKLIQYNLDGEITFYSGDSLEIIPEYTPNEFAENGYTIETTIA